MAQGNRRSAAGSGSSELVSRKAPKQRIHSIRCLAWADGVSLLGFPAHTLPYRRGKFITLSTASAPTAFAVGTQRVEKVFSPR